MSQVLKSALVGLVAAGSLGVSALAQCPDWREQRPMSAGWDAHAVISWDPDGAGPQPPDQEQRGEDAAL